MGGDKKKESLHKGRKGVSAAYIEIGVDGIQGSSTKRSTGVEWDQ